MEKFFDVQLWAMLAAVITSLLFSFLKPHGWKSETKQRVSWFAALLASIALALYQSLKGAIDFNVQTVALIFPTVVGAMQVWYTWIAENVGIEQFTRSLQTTVASALPRADIAGRYAEFQTRNNALSRELAQGNITGQQYTAMQTALQQEYRSTLDAVRAVSSLVAQKPPG